MQQQDETIKALRVQIDSYKQALRNHENGELTSELKQAKKLLILTKTL